MSEFKVGDVVQVRRWDNPTAELVFNIIDMNSQQYQGRIGKVVAIIKTDKPVPGLIMGSTLADTAVLEFGDGEQAGFYFHQIVKLKNVSPQSPEEAATDE